MSRSLLSLLALACVFTVGCPGGTGSTEDKDVGGTETGESGVDCFDEDGDGYCTSDGDCDDNDPSVSPDADEICDGNDNNCNGEIDENGETVFYADSDGDGFGDPDMSVTACEPDSGFVANSDDCDDRESMVYPGADEQCDGLDNDCDRVVDEDLTTTFYRDADGDGYGDEGWAVEECTSPGEGWVGSGGDCDDSEPFAWTGATELCDSVDNDCNGTVDDGLSTRWYPDADGDGYGDESAAMDSCVDPGAGYLSTGGDCDDGEPRAWTGASEYCDTVDNDCNGLVDDDALDATDQIADDDGDGFGSPTEVVWACSPIVDNTLDCDDGNAREPQVVDDSASASSADGSMTNPWTTIQDGIDNARMCVAVMEGAYYENVNFNGADVDVFSTAGREATVLDAGGTGTVVTFENGETAGAALRGFTVQNGGGALDSYSVSDPECASTSICVSTYNTYLGGGILVDGASPTLSDLWVTGNILPVATVVEHSETEIEYTRSYGGGIFVRNAVGGMAVTDVTVDWNYADQGGGVFVGEGSGIDFSQTRFNYNEATQGGGYVVSGGSTVELTNAILAGNWATDGGAAWLDGGSSMWWNVTAVGNEGVNGAGVAITDSGAFSFYSSTIVESTGGAGVYGDETASFAAEYSNVYGSTGGDFSGVSDPTGTSGNLMVAASFTRWTDDNTDNDDLSLAGSSLLIDAGNPSAAYNDTDGTRNDIGAYGGPGGGW